MLKTEMRNPNTMHFDTMSSAEQVMAMCRENQNAVYAVEKAAPEIAKAVDAVTAAFEKTKQLGK
jgi:N-acetylmuramic acid 6-phosphate etherase